jgi:hypothetical protein
MGISMADESASPIVVKEQWKPSHWADKVIHRNLHKKVNMFEEIWGKLKEV